MAFGRRVREFSLQTPLTNAQIKALPGTPVTLLAGQGSGTVILVTFGLLEIDATLGIYTGMDATGSGIFISCGGAGVGTGAENSAVPLWTGLSDLMAHAGKRAVQMIPGNDATLGYAAPLVFTPADLDNQPLKIEGFDNSASAWTGGNAGNSGRVTLSYRIYHIQ